MIYRRFGRTELRMPVFSCGGMRYQQSWRRGTPVGAASQRNVDETIDRAFALGINHIETARGYGTSEAQLGPALARHPRDSFILQTKIAPTENPKEFEKHLEESFAALKVAHLDLFAFHGLNTPAYFDRVLRPGGCLEVVLRWRQQGRIKSIGFSTHAPTALIVEGLRSGKFDYVNLHYYYIFQDNRPALEAARAQDMGVFIISPTDKGGRLYQAPPKLRDLCAPLSPLLFNDLFCLHHPEIHTLSIGAAQPSDFDEHMEVLPFLEGGQSAEETLGPILARLEAAYRGAVGDEFARRWREGLREWDELPGQVNVRRILWLWNLVRAFDLLDFAQERYAAMDPADHWVPGARADDIIDEDFIAALPESPFRNEIPGLLRDAHQALFNPDVEPGP